MSVTFVIGRAGSGKTLHCRTSIAAALRASPLGPPIYWLLPRQGTFTAERQLTCGSGLEGFCRARVASFEQFAQDIFNDCGGSAVPEVTGIGRQMILGHLLRKLAPRLIYFGSVARQIGLAAELDVTFAELERAGKTAADLQSVVDELSPSGAEDIEAGSLAAKLHDLHLIYEQYTQFLGNDRLDQHRRLTQVLEGIERCSFLSGATLFVDGFTDFTDFQRRMLAAAGRAGAAVKITLLIDPHSPTLADPHQLPIETSLFHRTESTFRKLWFAFAEAGVSINPPIILESIRRFTSPALARMEGDFFEPGEQQSEFSDLGQDALIEVAGVAIHRIEAADAKAEVDAAAREIGGLLQGGCRLRDIAVLARDIGQYEMLISASFDEHEIPYFMDRRRAAVHHPLLQFLRSALRLARHDWLDEAVMSFVKSGLAGITFDEADELENYVLLHRVRGEGWETPEPWNFRRQQTLSGDDPAIATTAPQPPRIDSIRRRVVEPLVPFVKLIREGHPLPVRRFATEIFALLDAFKVRQTLVQWMNEAAAAPAAGAVSVLEQRDEHEQVWSALVELFEELVELLGDQLMSPTEFVEVLESGLERFDLALTPPTVDQVLVGQVDRTICPPVRAVIVLGLNAGEFPAVARDQTVLSDRERRELGRRKMELDPESRRRVLDEPLLAYMAFTQASETLIFMRSESDSRGRKTSPSVFWQRLGDLFPQRPAMQIPAARADDVAQISTARQLVTSVMRRVRNGAVDSAAVAGGAPWRALYQWLATRAPGNDAVSHLRSHAWPALNYRNNASLSDDANRALFPSPLKTTAAQLETFAACPFRHFVRYGLRLKTRPRREVTMLDLGRVYRSVLEKLFKQVIGSQPNDDDPLPITPQMIGSAVRAVGRTLHGELMLSTARNEYLLHRVEQTLIQVIESQRELMKHFRFRPSQVPVVFGDQANLPALSITTPAGAQVHVEGKMDRVDTLPQGNDAVALDYRLSVGPLSLAKVFYGLSLQSVTHLLAISAAGVLPGQHPRPVGAFSLPLLRSLGDVAHPDEALDPSDPRYLLALKPRGVFSGQSLSDLDRELSEGRSMAVAAFITKSGALGHRGTTDATEADEFTALLRHTQDRIATLADQILAGNIQVLPYRLNQESPCARCEYQGVCRFETSVNNYRHLGGMGRAQVLDSLKGIGDGK